MSSSQWLPPPLETATADSRCPTLSRAVPASDPAHNNTHTSAPGFENNSALAPAPTPAQPFFHLAPVLYPDLAHAFPFALDLALGVGIGVSVALARTPALVLALVLAPVPAPAFILSLFVLTLPLFQFPPI